MKEIAENIFQTTYKEYKDYESFFAKKNKTAEERRQEIAKFVLENQEDQEAVINKVFESGVGYMFHEKDLYTLKVKLYTTYKAYEDILEIPQEVRTEINNFKTDPLYYLIENGVEKELSTDLIQEIKNQIKKEYNKVLEESFKTLEKKE